MRRGKDTEDEEDYETIFGIAQSKLPQRRPLKKERKRNPSKLPNRAKKSLRAVQDRGFVKLYREGAKLEQKHRRSNK
jgi:hypothetical protein